MSRWSLLIISLIAYMFNACNYSPSKNDSKQKNTDSTSALNGQIHRTCSIGNTSERMKIDSYFSSSDTVVNRIDSLEVLTFLTENKDKKEIVKDYIEGSNDTTLYLGVNANIIIKNLALSPDKNDTIIVTRTMLNNTYRLSDIQRFVIASIHFEELKRDSLCFSIVMTLPDSDIGYDFRLSVKNKKKSIVLKDLLI